ncbi:hypothetical protein BU14_0283s0002 [Porphyra umbilicalis]|uniref:NB-ARC domain-containing protein n=1 Tax=Porphyra umbilicalis TaxID=2786 RepID=A0A1X6P122_PORUM|nr:hypothetical protein BU14_0283s0002 [Porphyra umbilicalis]|eukprot:OSX74569.1 hypothetical protein BU14_0283s0002 [Porphyra umbilicalis]
MAAGCPVAEGATSGAAAQASVVGAVEAVPPAAADTADGGAPASGPARGGPPAAVPDEGDTAGPSAAMGVGASGSAAAGPIGGAGCDAEATEYPMATFRVLSCESTVKKLKRGTVLHALLGRNLYLAPAKAQAPPPASVVDLVKRKLRCVHLPREDCDLRVANAADAKRAGVDLTNHLLWVRGMERSTAHGGCDLGRITLLLKADDAGVCASWATAGSFLAHSWSSLLPAGVADETSVAAVTRLLDETHPLAPTRSGKVSDAVFVLLGTSGRRAVLKASLWLQPTPCVGAPVASVVKKVADAVGQVSGVPAVEIALRVACLVVHIGAVAIRVRDHADLCTSVAKRCSELAHELLKHLLGTLQLLKTDFGVAHQERLCRLLSQLETLLEQVEEAVLVGLVGRVTSDQTIRGLKSKLDELVHKVGEQRQHGALGMAVMRIEHEVSRPPGSVAQALGPDLSLYKVRRIPPRLDERTYVPGVSTPGRAEHTILCKLQQHARNGVSLAPRLGICAIGGSGKSFACAGLVACGAIKELYPGGTVWVQLNASSTAVTIIEDVMALVYRFCTKDVANALFRLKEQADFVSLAASHVGSVSAERAGEQLVVIDDVLDSKRNLLHTLLRVAPSAAPVLFTTRSQAVVESVPEFTLVPIDSLPEADARAVLAKAVGRPAMEVESPFGAADEFDWVRRVLKKTERHALSLSIVGANIAQMGGAWRPVVDALEQKWMDLGCEPLLDGLARSVRATLDMSLDLLPNNVSRVAFMACSVLPTNAKVAVCALERLWRPQLSGATTACEPSATSARHAEGVVVRDPVVQEIDTLVRAGLLRREVNADTGEVSSVTVHPVVSEYAAALLGPGRVVATHHFLVRDYLCGHGAMVEDGARRSYPFWMCTDDGYCYDNMARHVAASGDVWGLPWLLHSEWERLRVRTRSLLAYQGDVETVLAGLLLVADDKTCETRQSPQLQYSVYQGLANAYLGRIAGPRATNIERAISWVHRALDAAPRRNNAPKWASVQTTLGNAYSNRVTGDKGANLDKAIECYGLALQVWTRDAAPLDWATTQMNLGAAYSDHVTGDKGANVDTAIECYGLALQVWTRDAAPLDWAMTQMNLGNAYRNRVTGDKGANVDKAIECYGLALQVRTRDAAPLQWAMTQMNLGTAYSDRVTGDKGANVDKAIECYGLALQVRTRDAAPLQWAMTQMNLGNAYSNCVTGDKGANVDKAVECHGLALQVWTRDAAPLDWAMTHMNLGAAYSDRVTGDKGANADKAIECYGLVLQVWTRHAAPLQWAITQMILGNAYSDRVTGDKGANVDKAIECYGLALQVWTRDAAPLDWATTQMNLGTAYSDRVTGDKGANVDKAIECYGLALQVRTRDAAPLDWAMTQTNLGNAYRNRVTGDKGANADKAIECYGLALQVWTRDAAPLQWAMTQMNLGAAYRNRVTGDKGANVDKAIECYGLALQVRTRETAPQGWAHATFILLLAQLDAERWDAALVSARALQQFGPQWERWRQDGEFVVGRVHHIEVRLRRGRGRRSRPAVRALLRSLAHAFPAGHRGV